MSSQVFYQHTKLNGIAKVSLDGSVSWTNRFIIISDGATADTNNSGFWDIAMPPVGTAIPNTGGGTTVVTAAAGAQLGGIAIPMWGALWYRLPLEAGSTSAPGNFMVHNTYGTSFNPDEHWVCVVSREDYNEFKWADGSTLVIGEQSGTKAQSLQFWALNQKANQHNAGTIFVAPGIGGGLASAAAIGFTNYLRTIGAGNNPETSSYYDITQPAVGTIIYDVAGNPSGRTWRAPVAGDRLAQLGDLSRSWLPGGGSLNYATHPLADLQAEETLWFAVNMGVANNPASGTWHITPYSSGNQFVQPINWVLVAHRQNVAPTLEVFGGQSISPGDHTSHAQTLTGTMSRLRQAVQTPLQANVSTAWTPNTFFAGTGANGVLSSAAGAFVKWAGTLAYVGISDGFSSTMGGGGAGSGPQYTALAMPAAGTAIPVLGSATVTRVVDAVMGVPLAAWEYLVYLPADYTGGTGSVAGGWAVSSYSAAASLPYNAVKVAHFLYAGSNVPFSGVVPFLANGDVALSQASSRMWVMGEYYALGASNGGAVGNRGSIGSTAGYQTLLFGAAAAGATGAGVGAVQYPGFEAKFRITADRQTRTLRTTGLIQFPAAVTLSPGNVIAFMPGVNVNNATLTDALLQGQVGGGANYRNIDLRLQNATVAGVAGAQVVVAGLSPTNAPIAMGAGAWVDLRCFDGITLD
jgi:hypothetical protein